MDIVMVTRDRPELLEQTIRSMRENAADWSKHRLVVVFDGTQVEMDRMHPFNPREGQSWPMRGQDLGHTVIQTGEQLGVGGAKNFGAAWLSRGKASSDLLMFSDGDMWYGPGWDERLEGAVKEAALWPAGGGPAKLVTQLGGWRHPFHQFGRHLSGWHTGGQWPLEEEMWEVDAVTGNCFVIRWSDWLTYGPFDANATGPGQSEDYALSQRIKAGGGIVATLDPPVAIHCGLVNSSGEPAVGWREMEQQITGQLAVLPEAMRNEVLILRPAPIRGQIPMVSGRTMFVAPNQERMTIERISFETDQPERNEYQYRYTPRKSPDPAKLRQMGMEQSKQEQLDNAGFSGLRASMWYWECSTHNHSGSGYDTPEAALARANEHQRSQLRLHSGKSSCHITTDLVQVPVVSSQYAPGADYSVAELGTWPDGYEHRENWPTEADAAAVVQKMRAGGYTIDQQKLEDGASRLNAAAVEMGLMEPSTRYIRNAPLIEQTFSKFLGVEDTRPIGVNVGSGQRRFESTREVRWINCDIQQVPPDRIPDIICNVGVEKLPFDDGTAQYVVLHQMLEHSGCGESEPMLRECWRVLARGGSLIITVPDMRKLAARWLGGEMDDQLYMTNVYGAYMGDEADRHRWGFSAGSLFSYVHGVLPSDAEPHVFDWREIPGASIARDWWVAAAEFVKR